MISIICLIFSVLLNIRLAYCLGKHYKWVDSARRVAQGGRKVLEAEVERLNSENNLSDKDIKDD